MKYLTVFSDASFHRETQAGGYAFFVRDDQTIIKRSFGLKWKAKSSAWLEYFACCHAILHAANNLPNAPGDCVVAQTDCTHVIESFSGNTSLTTSEENMRGSVLAQLDFIGLSLRFKHVKAHTSSEDARSYVNRWCDVSARRQMRMRRVRQEGAIA